MNAHTSKLYLVLGAWVSFVAIVMAGTILLPPSNALAQHSQALLYKLATNEELVHSARGSLRKKHSRRPRSNDRLSL